MLQAVIRHCPPLTQCRHGGAQVVEAAAVRTLASHRLHSQTPELARGVCFVLFPHLLHQELAQSFDETGKFQRWNLFVRVLGAC